MAIDQILLNAFQRRDEALKEARRWTLFIEMYQEVSGADVRPNRTRGEHSQLSSRAAETGELAKTEAAALKIIERLGTPVPTRELLGELAAMGIEVGGKDPASTLSARLSRAPSLENVRPYGWRRRQEIPKGREATDPTVRTESVASQNQPSSPDESRTEVAHVDIDNLL